MSTTEIVPDAVRLHKVLRHIQANLSSWNQQCWVGSNECGTTYCFAGWALQLSDIAVCDEQCECDDVFFHTAHVHASRLPQWVLDRVGVMSERPYDTTLAGDDLYGVPSAARAVLGLKVHESWSLFCASNDLHQITRLVNQYAAIAGGGGAAGN